MFTASLAYAMAPGGEVGMQGGGASWQGIVPLVIIFFIFYIMLIRPQQKKAKEHNEMLNNLQKGDQVVTNGGLLGRILEINDKWLRIEVSDNVEVKVARGFIADLVERKGKKDEGSKKAAKK